MRKGKRKRKEENEIQVQKHEVRDINTKVKKKERGINTRGEEGGSQKF